MVLKLVTNLNHRRSNRSVKTAISIFLSFRLLYWCSKMKRQSFSDLSENLQVYEVIVILSELKKSKDLDHKQRFHAVTSKSD